MMRHVWVLIALYVLAPYSLFAQDEQYRSFEVSSADTFVLTADPRLELGPEGTIELWVSASAEQPTENAGAQGKELCILQSGDHDSGIGFRIAILPNGAGIAIYRDDMSSGVSSSFPILGKGEIHVAFVTAGTGTVILVNGSAGGSDSLGVPSDIGTFQYLLPVPSGRSLHFGCDGSHPTAHVWLRTVRLWNRALSQDELKWASTFSGYPDGRPEVTQHLAAYSLFTDQRTEVRFTSPRIQFTDFAGSDGDPFFLRRPPTQQLAAIYVPNVLSGTTHRLADMQLEFDDTTRRLELTGDATHAHTMPTVVAAKPTSVNWISAAFLRDLLEPQETRRDDPRTLAMYQAAFKTARTTARHRLLGFSDDQNGVAFPDKHTTLRFSINLGDRFRRLTGLSDGAYITRLRIDSTEAGGNLRSGPAVLQGPVTVGTVTSSFSLVLPPGAQFEGLAGRTKEGHLSALALAYSYPDGSDSGPISADSLRSLWIDRDDKQPTRDTDTTPDATGAPRLLRGDYSNQRGYRIQIDPLKDNMTITVTEPSTSTVAPETFTFGHPAGSNRWVVNNAQGQRELIVGKDTIHWIGADSLYERTLIPAPPYEAPGPDKLPWGATFSLGHRPPLVEANFKGYFPYAMRARDFQATTGVDKMVFAMPAETSLGYSTTGSQIIVPHGLYFRLDNKGVEQNNTFVYKTTEDRQFGWNVNLGAKVGIPGIFSFSEDFDYQTSQEQMSASESASTLTRSIGTHYALVMDLARMKLDPEFEERIFEMRDRYLINLPRDWKAFFMTFGTHYPYAVTYGGVAWMESYTDKMDINTKNSEAMNVKVAAEGTFEKIFNIGVKLGGGYNATTSEDGGTESTVTIFGTNGGSFSRGGGWSLTRGEEVPILLDLRPIHQLFSPAFFLDPLVWGALRHEAVEAYNKLVRELAQDTVNNHQWDSLRMDPQAWKPEN